jgi:hypothetical protein
VEISTLFCFDRGNYFDEILELNIPTGVPLVYEFDENFKPIKHYYLGNAEEVSGDDHALTAFQARQNGFVPVRHDAVDGQRQAFSV